MRLIVTVSLIALAGCFTDITNSISDNLDRCVELSQSTLDCARHVKDNRQQLYERIEEIEELKETMDYIMQEMQIIQQTTDIPHGGRELAVQLQYLKGDVEYILKWLHQEAYPMIQGLEAKFSEWEDKADESIEKAERAINTLQHINQKCSRRKWDLMETSSCVRSLPDGSTQQTIQQKLEIFGAAVNTKLMRLNERMSTVERRCLSIADNARGAAGNPFDLLQRISGFRDAITSITQFFNKVKKMENEEICEPGVVIPPQLRWLREISEEQTGEKCYRIGLILRKPEIVSSKIVTAAVAKADVVLKDRPDFDLFSALPNFNGLYNIEVKDLPEIPVPTEAEVYQNLNILTGSCVDQMKQACETGDIATITSCNVAIPLGYDSVSSIVSAVRALRGLKLNLNLDGNYGPSSPSAPVYQREMTTPPHLGPAAMYNASEHGLYGGESGSPYGSESGSPFGGSPYGSESGSPYGGSPYGSESGSPYGGSAYGSESGSPYGGSPYGSESGSPYGSESGSPYGGSSYGSVSGSPYGGSPYGSESGSPYGGSPYGGSPYGSESGSPYGSESGSPYGSESGSPYGGSPYGDESGSPYGGSPHGGETGFYGGETEEYYRQTIRQSMSEIKDILRYLSEEQLNHFISGLEQILQLMKKHEAQIVVDTLHHILLSELLNYDYAGLAPKAVYGETTPYPVEYAAGSTPIYPTEIETGTDLIAEQVRSLMDKTQQEPGKRPGGRGPTTSTERTGENNAQTSSASAPPTASDDSATSSSPKPTSSSDATEKIRDLIQRIKQALKFD